MRRILCVTTALLIMIASANAETIMATGPGSETCGFFAKAYRLSPQRTEQLYFSWAEGFMNGANLLAYGLGGTLRDISSMPTNEQEMRIRNYCDEHPLEQYMQAVLILYMQLPPTKPTIKN